MNLALSLSLAGSRLASNPYAAFTAAYDFSNADGTTLSGSDITDAHNLGSGGAGYDLADFSAGTRPALTSNQGVWAAGDALVNLSSDLGTLLRLHDFQFIFDGEINNLSNSPVLLAGHPATGNGRIAIQALATTGKTRINVRNAANTNIVQVDTNTTITDGVPFILSVSISGGLLSVDYGTGGTTSPIVVDQDISAISGQDVLYPNVAVGCFIINGALSGLNQAAMKVNEIKIASLS